MIPIGLASSLHRLKDMSDRTKTPQGHPRVEHSESYKMSVAETGKLPASALEKEPVPEEEPENSWLAAEARRRERARLRTEPLRKDLITRQGRRLASGTSYLSVPTRGKPAQVESRADTVEQLRTDSGNFKVAGD